MAQASPKPVEGIQWPVTDKSSGERGSTKTSQQIWAKSFAAMDSSVSEQVEREKNWRYKYARFVKQHVQLSLQTPENALNAAKAGLDEFHNKFEFIRDGQVYTLGEAMSKFDRKIFETGVIKGKKERPAQGYQYGVPYKGGVLQGDALLAQLKKWAERGTIEPDTAEAIGKVASSSVNLDLSDLYFVLLGAGSAMGPYSILMSLGANVIALDIDRPMAWKRLISIAEESPGTLIFPTKKSIEGLTRDQIFEVAGCNLMTQTPEITRWLRDLYPEKDLIIGTYVYLDGEAHVRVALACDAIVKSLCERTKKPSLVYLCTPTDVHVIPQAASQAASKNYSDTGLKNLALLPIKVIPGHGKLVRNVQPKIVAKDGTEFYIVDGIVVAQGPNYALAKRMQHWRAIVARSQGCVVSSHIAPSTSTASVTSNRSFAWAYDGMPYFRPYEIPVQDTSNAVMAALLIHDVRNKAAPANPSYPLKNPLELFKFNSFHGGLWRSGYTINTIGEVSVLIHFIKVGKPVIFVFAILAVAALLRFFGRI